MDTQARNHFDLAVTVLQSIDVGAKPKYRDEDLGGYLDVVNTLRGVPRGGFRGEFAKLLHADARLKPLVEAVFKRPEPEVIEVPAGRKSTGPFEMYYGDAITKLPPKEWLIDRILGEKDFVMVFGASQSGKTFTSIDLVMCAITGHKFAGQFEVAHPLTVVYLTNEGTSGIPGRIRAAAEWHKPTDEDWNRLYVSTDLLQFVNDKGTFHYRKFIDQWQRDCPDVKLDLIVLDHLSGTLPGKGDSDQPAATLVGEALAHIRKELGAGVLVIHHCGLDGSRPRGMTNYKDIADQMLWTESLDNPHTLKCYKLKDGKKWDKLTFEIIADPTDESAHVEWVATSREPSRSLEGEWDIIAGLVTAAGKMNQSQLVAAIKESELKFGRDKSRSYIASAVRNGKINETPSGLGNPTIYTPVDLAGDLFR